MAERFKAPVLKTGVRLTRTVGSNPTPSANIQKVYTGHIGNTLYRRPPGEIILCEAF